MTPTLTTKWTIGQNGNWCRVPVELSRIDGKWIERRDFTQTQAATVRAEPQDIRRLEE